MNPPRSPSTCGRTIGAAVASLAAPLVLAQSNIHPDHKFGWGENIGWTNWRGSDADGVGVVVGPTFVSGLVWAENVGWINVGDGTPADGVHYANTSGLDFGVNIDANGDLFGFAWGENIGWINFDTLSLGDDRAVFDACEHQFFGFAWGENAGWINLNDATHFVAVGPCALGDYDCDGDVDLDDWAAFVSFMAGPGVPVDCPAFDFDEDGDVDLADFAEFQAAFTG